MGGPGWSITRRFIFEQETTTRARHECRPWPSAVTMVGPVIFTFGNEAQKKKVFLPRHSLRRGLVVPGLFPSRDRASDLAHRSAPRQCATATITSSTVTRPWDPRWHRPRPTGFFFCPGPHRHVGESRRAGIFVSSSSNMKSPWGHRASESITIDGSHEVNDVFSPRDRCASTVENLIGGGKPGAGPTQKFLLGNERTSMAGIGPLETRLH